MVTGCSGSPNESVVPPSNQQIDPADTPISTTPASQAARMAWSTPCSRHSASKLATLPPITHTTSWASRCPVMSGTLGSANRARWLGRQPARPNAEYSAVSESGASPTAVATMQTRGLSPARASDAACA